MSSTDSRSTRPGDAEYPQFYGGYVRSVPDGDVVKYLRTSGNDLSTALNGINEERSAYKYQPDKWSIKSLAGHVSDTERIFSYRALRIARGDQTSLPGFDENAFATTAASDDRSLASIAAELRAVREATVLLFESLSADAWARAGTVNNGHITVRALAWITAGHARHHLNILRDRYGI